MRQPLQVLVYVVRRRGGQREYLLLHRTPRGGGFWQDVTGGAEDDETPIEAAHRELREETGFSPVRREDLNFTYTFPVADGWRYLYAPGTAEIREHVFLALVVDAAEPSIDPREHDDSRWCGFDAALGLLSWPDNIEGLRRADAWCQQEQPPG